MRSDSAFLMAARWQHASGLHIMAVAVAQWAGTGEMIMQTRNLGEALTVSVIGLGCMGMSDFYAPTDEAESIAVIRQAIEDGVTLLDTADMYGPFTNEVLVGKAIKGLRDRVVLATKFGNVRGPKGEFLGVCGRPDYVRQACDASLKRLGVDVIDLLLPAPCGYRHTH
jgi:aryl-alcohol dehydrogenase-like predicted oxidoreductase